MEFMTTISEIKAPQVVAINGRIHDNPTDPFQLEVMQCPFRLASDRVRFIYELFVRQQDFYLVILDIQGKIKYCRVIKPSKAMTLVHQRIAQMFDENPGKDITNAEMVKALQRHQSTLNPQTIRY